ncbi:MAG: hypothetical protein ACR5LD_07885 [Symbiopectobacterium sp.]
MKNPQFTALSDSIWDVPELNYEEMRSAVLHEVVLKQEGFRLNGYCRDVNQACWANLVPVNR